MFHASVLTKYQETEAHGKNFPRPASKILNKKEHYEVDAILDSRCQGRGTKYLVKWVGYPKADNTWEPFALLKGSADEVLREFHESYPNKLRPGSFQL